MRLGIGSKEQEERYGSTSSLLGLAEGACWYWDMHWSNKLAGRRLGGDYSIQRRCGQQGRKGCSWCSVAVLQRRQGIESGETVREEKICGQPTSFSGCMKFLKKQLNLIRSRWWKYVQCDNRVSNWNIERQSPLPSSLVHTVFCQFSEFKSLS